MFKKSSISFVPLLGLLLVIAASSCKKENEGAPDQAAPTGDSIYGKLITVTNLAPEITDDQDPTSTSRPPMYFSLEENKVVPASYAKTNRWDISFTNIYNSFIGANNGSNAANPGAGGPGKGGIYLVNQDFDQVKTVPDDALFRTSGSYGTDDSGDFGAGTGWYLYDFGGSIKGDGSYDFQHVVYPIQPRTLIVRTAKGNYAKIKMLSLYQNELDPSKWRRNTPHPYFTFQYLIVKEGNKHFTIQ